MMTDVDLTQLGTQGDKWIGGLLLPGTLEVAKNHRPFIIAEDNPIPDVTIAMDIAAATPTVMGCLGASGPDGEKALDNATNLGIESRLCSGNRIAAWQLQSGQLPKPDAIITTNSPCDSVSAIVSLLDRYEPWDDVPRFHFDIPHGLDDKSVDYVARQIKEGIAFLEKVTGQKLDYQRLVAVCNETNRHRKLMLELQELKRATPCAFEPGLTRNGFLASLWVSALRPELLPQVTPWCEQVLQLAESRVKQGLGMDGFTEKFRYLWYDPTPTWSGQLFPRLRQELGALDIMNLLAFIPENLIDTTSEDSLYNTMARRHLLTGPMTRQGMHTADFCCDEIVQLYRDFKCSAVVYPSHVGHRTTSSTYEIIKKTCEKNNMPFLFVGCDVWDDRYMPPDVVFERMKTFFEVVGLT